MSHVVLILKYNERNTILDGNAVHSLTNFIVLHIVPCGFNPNNQ